MILQNNLHKSIHISTVQTNTNQRPFCSQRVDNIIYYFIFFSFKFNQMASKESIKQRFEAARSKKMYNGIKMNREVSEIFTFIENTIKKQTESFNLFNSLCGAERRININPHFESSFLTLSLQEQTKYFQIIIDSLIEKQKQASIQFLTENELQFSDLPIKVQKGLKAGPSYKIKLTNYSLNCSHYEIPLSNYILRRSNKNKQIFVFQSLIKQEPLKIRFQIMNYSAQKDRTLVQQNDKNWIKYIVNLNKVEEHQQQPKVKLSKHNKETSEQGSPSKKTVTFLQVQSKKHLSPNVQNQALERSVIEEVFKTNNDFNAQSEIYQIIQQKQLELSRQQSKNNLKMYRKNIARIILPHVSFLDLQNFGDYLPVVRDDSHRLYIYQHSSRKQQFRMQLYLKQNCQVVVKHLCEIQNYKLWNGSINESHVKLSISSDNAYLAYFKHRSYSNMYRERDFLFLRHLCRVEETFYFVDSSIENSHFIPFQSIIRGKINYCVSKVQKFNKSQCRLLMELSIDHAGLLNLQDEVSQELTVRFLKQFVGLESFITRFKGQFKNPYDLNWQINLSNEQTQIFHDLAQSNLSITSNLFQGDSLASLTRNDDDDEFYSIVDELEHKPEEKVVRYEITQWQLKQKLKKEQEMKISYTSSEKIELDDNGQVILPKAYLKVRHAVAPIKLQQKKKINPFTHLMLKNDFVEDDGGGMKLSNPEKEAAQNNVIKFVMNTLKKNLFAGKGILNISLPVQIFNCDSNIQRFCQSLSMAPNLIERRKAQNPIQRFKNCVAFAFTNSVLYFDMDKAFNPILGETFQGFIDGCPVYAEQISHHPPISSVYMIGRGYKIYGNIEAKVYVHLNSGEGVNEGFYTIQFDDGGKVVYQTAPGEVSGLVVGNRKFRFKGKTFIVDAKNRLFCAINFEDETSGLFSKSKWKFTDQFDGEILRVSEPFIRSFFQKTEGKDFIIPGKKDIEQRLGKVSGRWLQSFKIDDEQYFNLKESPYEMIHYQFPLNSNSDYRQDLFYRKLNDLAKSQSEKERLEVKQRNDRKFREKFHGKH